MFAKVNFKIYFPPAYERRIWDFSRANIQGIRQAISGIDWDKSFSNVNVNDRVIFVTECILNVFYNFVPNKMITVRNKDAPWMTPEIKKMILDKAKIYRRYVKKGRNTCDYELLQDIILRCKTKINEAKFLYYKILVPLLLHRILVRRNIGPFYINF